MQYILIPLAAVLITCIITIILLKKRPMNEQEKMYYMMDIKNSSLSTITLPAFENKKRSLKNKDFEKILIDEVELFSRHKIILPKKSFLLLHSENYCETLKHALPALTNEKIHMYIFFPVSPYPANDANGSRQMNQLNEFIFSDEFKNIFSYTQPIFQ